MLRRGPTFPNKELSSPKRQYNRPSLSVEPTDTEGQLYYVILYKGLEHPRILVSLRGPGINPLWILSAHCGVEAENAYAKDSEQSKNSHIATENVAM